jgi:predicted acetyltransferase
MDPAQPPVIDIGEPTEADREQVALVGALAFNYPPRPDLVVLDGMLCAYRAGRVVATARAIPLAQWFGGRAVPCAGIASVAALPEHRREGLTTELVRALLRRERDRGRAVSALYPTTAAFYRRLGYEFAGVRVEHRAPIADLPPAGGQPEELADADLPAVMECFSRFAASHTGPVETRDPEWWRRRVFGAWDPESHTRAVVVRGDGGVEGYAGYSLERRGPGPGDHGYAVTCTHLVGTTARALRVLLGHFRGFENAARDLGWFGPPADPVGLLLGSNAFGIRVRVARWMGRILDVRAALEARGYPAVSGEAVLEVDDPLFPENRGPWRLRADRGAVSVEPAGTAPGSPVPVGILAPLFAGFVTPDDLVRTGLLRGDDPRLPLLRALFAGPIPWMPDFF